MELKLKEIEQLVNSELASKIKKTSILFEELLIETADEDLVDVILLIEYIFIDITISYCFILPPSKPPSIARNNHNAS